MKIAAARANTTGASFVCLRETPSLVFVLAEAGEGAAVFDVGAVTVEVLAGED